MIPENQQSFIDAYNQSEPSTPWVQNIKREAMANFCEEGFPDRKVEAWKYINLIPLNKKTFSLVKTATIEKKDIAALQLPETPRVVCVDGFFRADLSTIKNTENLTITSLKHAIANNPGFVKSHLAKSTSPTPLSFSDLNMALFQDGVVIHAKATEQANPILFLNITSGKHTMQHVRNLIVVEKNAALDLIEYHLSINASDALSTCINEIYLKDNSQTTILRLSSEHNNTQFTETRIEQSRDSRLTHHNYDINGQLVRHDIQINLNQAGANCTLNGLYYAKNKDYVDNHSIVHHRVSNTHSKEFYKGIADDKAKAVFNGIINIHPNAENTSTTQYNPNLLLSTQAEIDTKPQLEIFNNEVQASHGATVGQLDDDALFYLTSRGINKAMAEKILLHGFMQEIITEIPFEAWRDYLSQQYQFEEGYHDASIS